jgi:hypothetical protein
MLLAVDADDEADELYVDLADLKQQQQQSGSRHKAAAAAAAAQQQQQQSGSSEEEDDEQEGEDLLTDKDAVVVDEGVSDLDYLKARMRKSLPDEQQQQQRQDGSSGEDEEMGSSSSSSEGEDDDDAAAAAARDGERDVDMLGSEDQQLEEDEDAEADEAEGEAFDPAAAAAANDGQRSSAAAGGAAEAEVLETGRLFVRNLAYSAGEAELSQLFGGFGDLEGVHLVLDRWEQHCLILVYLLFALGKSVSFVVVVVALLVERCELSVSDGQPRKLLLLLASFKCCPYHHPAAAACLPACPTGRPSAHGALHMSSTSCLRMPWLLTGGWGWGVIIISIIIVTVFLTRGIHLQECHSHLIISGFQTTIRWVGDGHGGRRRLPDHWWAAVSCLSSLQS